MRTLAGVLSQARSVRAVSTAAILLLCVAAPVPVAARLASTAIYDTGPPNLFRHNIGRLNLMVSNVGVLGNPGWIDQAGAEWRGGEYLWAASLWVSAVSSIDNLAYTSTGLSRDGEFEFRPSEKSVDTIYPSFEGAPGGRRPGLSLDGDDDGDGVADEDRLNGKDDDGDRLIDEDYSGISQQMFSCEYWDDSDEAMSQYPRHRPLHLLVHQESYAWATQDAENLVGFDFKIKNMGLELLRRVYIGIVADPDIGPRWHDLYNEDDGGSYIGLDTTFVDPNSAYQCGGARPRNCGKREIRLDLCTMYDVPDDGGAARGGDVAGYFATQFLGHTTDPTGEWGPVQSQVHTARLLNNASAYPSGEPDDDAERYDLLQSGERQTRPTSVPADYGTCLSVGPFLELRPGQEVELQVALLVGEGRRGLLESALKAYQLHFGRWSNVDGDPGTGSGGRETCLRALSDGEPLIWRDPCRANDPYTLLIKDTECTPDHYVDADCDCCTPIIYLSDPVGGGGRETQIRWVGTFPPPSPLINLDQVKHGDGTVAPEGDRSVKLEWDNLSELSADPMEGRILFTGYRIWRTESWRRDPGSPGPSSDEWQLLADLSLQPQDGKGERSPWYLLNYRREVPRLNQVPTGSTIPGEAYGWRYAIGRYAYADTFGLKNGMRYFYDVTAYSAFDQDVRLPDGRHITVHQEYSGRPAALESDAVVPVWAAAENLEEVYAVPNPFIAGKNPDGWDLVPNQADPTGSRIAFVGLPANVDCGVSIYTLSGDLVRELDHDTRSGRTEAGRGAAFWDLRSRTGHPVTSGIYLYSVRCGGQRTTGHLVIVR